MLNILSPLPLACLIESQSNYARDLASQWISQDGITLIVYRGTYSLHTLLSTTAQNLENRLLSSTTITLQEFAYMPMYSALSWETYCNQAAIGPNCETILEDFTFYTNQRGCKKQLQHDDLFSFAVSSISSSPGFKISVKVLSQVLGVCLVALPPGEFRADNSSVPNKGTKRYVRNVVLLGTTSTASISFRSLHRQLINHTWLCKHTWDSAICRTCKTMGVDIQGD